MALLVMFYRFSLHWLSRSGGRLGAGGREARRRHGGAAHEEGANEKGCVLLLSRHSVYMGNAPRSRTLLLNQA